MKIQKSLLLFALMILPISELRASDELDVCKLGQAVLAIQNAIANPDAPYSLDAVKELGLKTAHYSMVRGWLVQELSGAESIKSSQKKVAINSVIDARIDFLKKAIRAIDLE